MSDENHAETPQDTDRRETQAQMVYESNPKHRDPWQIGKKGSLCEAEVRPLAKQLLEESVLWEGKRYAVHVGKAYYAQEHQPNRWHGYPADCSRTVLRQLAGNNLPAALWPVSDRATPPTEGLQYRGRPSVGGFGGVGDPRRTM